MSAETRLELRDVAIPIRDRVLVSNVHLRVGPGSVVVITGESGIGKTMMLRAIAGLASFHGTIVVNGTQISNDGNGGPLQDLVLVTQQPNLWEHLSTLDNVALIRRLRLGHKLSASRAEAMGYLTLLEIERVAHQYPRSLSGGEQQRVALARGLAAETAILLVDEGTSSIDPSRKDIVVRAMKQLAANGKTVVFVSHDEATVNALEGLTLRLAAEGLSEMSPAEQGRAPR